MFIGSCNFLTKTKQTVKNTRSSYRRRCLSGGGMRDIIYKRLDEKDLESFFKTVLTYPLNVKSELIAILPEWMKKVLRKMLSAVMR